MNTKALILLHGRGATAQDILGIASYLNVQNTTLIAPQAPDYAWYPQPFTEPLEKNEPKLSQSLLLVNHKVQEVAKTLPTEKIFFLGFSQGACLSLEYVNRNKKRYGGVFALSGGLIGPEGISWNNEGDFQKTPIFLGCDSRDPYIPLKRVEDSARHLEKYNANVDKRIYEGLGHTINQDELDAINMILDRG